MEYFFKFGESALIIYIDSKTHKIYCSAFLVSLIFSILADIYIWIYGYMVRLPDDKRKS